MTIPLLPIDEGSEWARTIFIPVVQHVDDIAPENVSFYLGLMMGSLCQQIRQRLPYSVVEALLKQQLLILRATGRPDETEEESLT